MNNIDVKGLATVLTEANALANGNMSKHEQRRHATLLAMAACLRQGGITLADLEAEDRNAKLAKLGESPIAVRNDKQAIEARGWQNFVEQRDMVEGNPISRIGTYTGLGFFVPTDFFPQVFAAMKAHDALFDDDVCTVIHSTNGRPLPVPVYGDTENVASVIGEGSPQSSVDIDSTGHAVIGAYSYATPRFVASREAFEDLEGALSVINLFRKFSADRLARGISADMVTGNGTGKTLGLIQSLIAVSAPTVTAVGSSTNTGGSETGANSLGSADFESAFENLDDAYANSDKVCWLMTKKTLAKVSGIVTKQGLQLNLVKYEDGQPCIYGIPVRICPSMDAIGASKYPVVLGDASYWATRLITGEDSGVRVYTEAPGLIDQGNFGLKTFVRADGALLYTDTGSPCPFVLIQNHS